MPRKKSNIGRKTRSARQASKSRQTSTTPSPVPPSSPTPGPSTVPPTSPTPGPSTVPPTSPSAGPSRISPMSLTSSPDLAIAGPSGRVSSPPSGPSRVPPTSPSRFSPFSFSSSSPDTSRRVSPLYSTPRNVFRVRTRQPLSPSPDRNLPIPGTSLLSRVPPLPSSYLSPDLVRPGPSRVSPISFIPSPDRDSRVPVSPTSSSSFDEDLFAYGPDFSPPSTPSPTPSVDFRNRAIIESHFHSPSPEPFSLPSRITPVPSPEPSTSLPSRITPVPSPEPSTSLPSRITPEPSPGASRYFLRRRGRSVESSPDVEAEIESNLNRLRRVRSRSRVIRELETADQRAERLRINRERSRQIRDSETAQDRDNRLRSERTRSSRTRELETVEQRENRMRNDRERSQRRRDRSIPRERQTEIETVRPQEWQDFNRAAFNYVPIQNLAEGGLLDIGRRDKPCSYCKALKWNSEAPSLCCFNGKVFLEPVETPPPALKNLFRGISRDSKHFLSNIRDYNQAFQMTSFGAEKIIRAEGGFQSTFKVQGQVYHRIGSIFPSSGQELKYLQIYFIGGNPIEETRRRSSIADGTHQRIITKIQGVLHRFNNYVIGFKTAIERAPEGEDFQLIIHADRVPRGEHERRFNAPAIDEVAILISGQQFETRDIIIESRVGVLKRITETHRSYDALQYPVIFWWGEDGYNLGIQQVIADTRESNPNKKVSAMKFYAYRLMFREEEFNTLLKSRQLLNQFAVDMYAKIESERLLYIRLNQVQLRATDYIHLRDAVENDANFNYLDLGSIVILPSTFVGGPRYMFEHTQDAMSYVRIHGRPSLFITFTCNHAWVEIKRELLAGQSAYERHDVVARVFGLKIDVFLNLITKGCIFGNVSCYMYSVEWQKRGLPHAHFLFWLKEPIRPAEIDKIISAEFPDPSLDKPLYDIVKKCMVHGPCGSINLNSPCMIDKNGIKKCSTGYPKKHVSETLVGGDTGYPLYRRRSQSEGGFYSTKTINGQDIILDNSWVVPYCPYLTRLFDAHINVEYCSSVKSIKYICKYVNKGTDQAIFTVGSRTNDEVKVYQSGRYISSNEAFWRIFQLPIHRRSPAVVHLSVHLENRQRVIFSEANANQVAANAPDTTLTAFFKLCESDTFARTLLYHEVPKFFTWDDSSKKFKRLVKGVPVEGFPGIKATDTIGRVYSIHPKHFECFCLRLLLHEVRGPTSFRDLKTVNNILCVTFQEACSRLGLLADDSIWDKTLADAVLISSPPSLRHLFSVMVTACHISNAFGLWDKYKVFMAEDLERRLRSLGVEVEEERIYNHALVLIEDLVLSMSGLNLQHFSSQFPEPNRDLFFHSLSADTSVSDDRILQSFYIAENEPRLVPDQRHALDLVLSRIERGNGAMIFIDAPGGTGKTFLLNLLLAKVREEGKTAIAVASSGIAATLLRGGQTAHSAFNIPLNVTSKEIPYCNIDRSSQLGKNLQKCSLIVWDEITMAHKKNVEALENSLRDIRRTNQFMGGVTLVVSGDFRQILPVVARGTPADELDACLKNSRLWRKIEIVKLTTNLRVLLSNAEEDRNQASNFAQILLEIGNGLIPKDSESQINIPSGCGVNVHDLEDLISNIYPELNSHFMNQEWLRERAILAPRNDVVNSINLKLFSRLEGNESIFKSIDSVDPEEAVNFPVEFLNSLDLAGLPPHILNLKKGAPIILLRNLNAPILCNGTRLVIKDLKSNLIHATILTGCGAGEDVFIPRIPLQSKDMPFEFTRLQFPVRLAYAMTINKSQGQTLRFAGLYLYNGSCFSHGQFDVGCSRVGDSRNLFICTSDSKTHNVVYPQALV